MKIPITRREFVAGLAAASSISLVNPSLSMAHMPSQAGRAPLPQPHFYWGVGVENCWIPQADPVRDGNRRLLDVFLQMNHYKKWKEDLKLAADVGVDSIRYSVPWYKAEPKPGVYDWSWIDGPVSYLVNELKIIPIMDIIHYGTPTWMPDGVIDERFPEAIGRYAEAMAKHFGGLVNHYSPHNEPQLTALFCGYTGRWPPYHKSVESWVRIGAQAAKGMIHETVGIRRAIPDPVIMSVDPMFYWAVGEHLPKGDPEDPEHREMRRAAAAYPSSLAYGKVRPGDRFADFLLKHGLTRDELEWFIAHAARPNLVGFNYYPDIFVFSQEGDFTRKGKVPLDQAAAEAAKYTEDGVRDAYDYFRQPIVITETSAGLTTEAKIAFMNALYESTLRLRQDLPFRGIIWWPLFNTIQWDYRENPDKPVADFIRPGGWNNGLYVIEPTPEGELKRVHTPAADAYRALIQRDVKQRKGAQAAAIGL